MQLVFLFRKLVFFQVTLGILAFCIAEGNPGLLLVAGALAVLAWYVAEGPTGQPVPKVVINTGSITAVLWLVFDLVVRHEEMLIAMGHFTMWLQVLMLYAKKSNREYAQMLILSLLQMVGASILSVSMIYGFLLAGYCVIALFTVVLFQMKLTSDQVLEGAQDAAPRGVRVARTKPVVCKGHRWQFRTTALTVGIFSGLIAVVVFVLLPRDSTIAQRSKLAQMVEPRRKTTQFTSRVTLDGGAPSAGSRQTVLTMRITRNGRPIEQEDRKWLLRGAALDRYDKDSRSWVRSTSREDQDVVLNVPETGVQLVELSDDEPVLDAQITLRQTGDGTLFTLHPITYIGGASLDKVTFNPEDQQLSAIDSIGSAVMYHHRVALDAPDGMFEQYRDRWPVRKWRPPHRSRLRRHTQLSGAAAPAPAAGEARPDTRQVQRDTGAADVQGDDKHPPARAHHPDTPIERERESPILEPLAKWFRGRANVRRSKNDDRYWPTRLHLQRVSALARTKVMDAGVPGDRLEPAIPTDPAIVNALVRFLQQDFEYSLTYPPGPENYDPVIEFLFHRREGHCELFASALAAMTRSLGMRSRVVTGFLTTEFNRVGRYYVARQSNAHAWCEVHCGTRGWVTFDATPVQPVLAEHRASTGWFATLRQAYEHLEFVWIRTVISYDAEARKRVLFEINESFQKATVKQDSWFGGVSRWLRDFPMLWRANQSSVTLMVVIAVALTAALLVLARTLWVQRLRVDTLQLHKIDKSERRGLVRRLRFYLTMLDMLERHGHVRPSWQSPYSFAESLTRGTASANDANPASTFEPVAVLTRHFYEIRFGRRALDVDRRRDIHQLLRQLELNLGAL
ncbi:MAG: DUF3488 and DUF4129 domain-containing transglutaminase family protein [Phycisphaeraceae bacterium]|nr:DUF3488 and DUF4129 domain-containing transglutaminase family protein [Phycisphaeraceae bacterium]